MMNLQRVTGRSRHLQSEYEVCPREGEAPAEPFSPQEHLFAVAARREPRPPVLLVVRRVPANRFASELAVNPRSPRRGFQLC